MCRTGILLLLGLGTQGCIDSRLRFDEFSEKIAKKNASVDDGGGVPSGGCITPTAEQLAGSYLFALSAKPSPDNPILALLTVKPELKDGKIVGSVLFEPLAIKDGMSTVGVKNQGTFELDSNQLTTPAFHVVLPGEANPVSPGLKAEADIIFSGTVCLDDSMVARSFCGAASGDITAPLTLPLEGSTFGAVRIEKGQPWPKSFAACE